MKAKSQLGDMKMVLNTARRNFSNADQKYWSVWVKMPNGSYQALLLTEEDFVKCKNRAYRNDEDVPSLHISFTETVSRAFSKILGKL